jgi:hypothetical protein
MWTAFDYLYRDAANFKAFGTIALRGGLSEADQQLIRERLDGGEYFIAEQVGVPPLYEHLYRWSYGPTQSDHCWHEFVGFRMVRTPEANMPTDEAAGLVGRFRSVSEWDGRLSRHFELARGV